MLRKRGGRHVNIVAQTNPGVQTAFLSLPDIVQFVLWGGGRGSGKSHGIILDIARCNDRWGSKFRALVLRRNYTDLKDLIALAKRILGPLGWVFNIQSKVLRSPEGAEIIFGHAESDDDIDAYQGFSLVRLYLDEVSLFPDMNRLMLLFATLRSPFGLPTRMVCTSNPNGPGAAWLRKHIIDVSIPYKPFAFNPLGTDNPEDGVVAMYLPATYRDNPALNQAEYLRNLKIAAGSNKALYDAWVDGAWTIVDSAAFPEWNPKVHTFAGEPYIPRNWGLMGSLDWGYKDDSVFLLHSRSPDNRNSQIIFEDVWKQRDAKTAGQMLGRVLLDEGVPGRMLIFCDGQMSAITGAADGRTILADFQDGLNESMGVLSPICVGVPHGPGAVAKGFGMMKQALAYRFDKATGVIKPPSTTISALRCPMLINSIMNVPLSKRSVDAYDTKSKLDHPLDSWRYLLMGGPQMQSAPVIRPVHEDRHPGFEWTQEGPRKKPRNDRLNMSEAGTRPGLAPWSQWEPAE